MRIHRIRGLLAYCYLIETPASIFLVDGGMVGAGQAVLRRILEIGRDPHELVFALVTHGHADHFGGLGEVQEASGCAIFCHPAHADTLRTGSGIASPGVSASGRVYKRIADLVLSRLELPKLARVTALEDGAQLREFGLSGRILYTPGHSTGDLTLVLEDGSAFVGDLVQGRRVPGIARPEFSVMAVDEEAMLESWRKLLDSGAKVVYPGHGRIVSAGDLGPVLQRAEARMQAACDTVAPPRRRLKNRGAR